MGTPFSDQRRPPRTAPFRQQTPPPVVLGSERHVAPGSERNDHGGFRFGTPKGELCAQGLHRVQGIHRRILGDSEHEAGGPGGEAGGPKSLVIPALVSLYIYILEVKSAIFLMVDLVL